MDQELKDPLDEIKREIRQTQDQLQDEIQQLRALVVKRGDAIRQLAEGVMSMNEKLESFRVEVAQQFDEMRSFLTLPYKDLDGRVKDLESWRERTERDPDDLTRERFGRSKH